MSNIMLCTEKLEVGGAETALITQALAMRKKGHNVVVLAQDGIYTDVLKNNEIDEIIETNYRFIHNNLNIDEKVFLLENEKVEYSHIDLLERMLIIQNDLLDDLKTAKAISDDIWNQKEYLQNENNILKEENKRFKKFLNQK